MSDYMDQLERRSNKTVESDDVEFHDEKVLPEQQLDFAMFSENMSAPAMLQTGQQIKRATSEGDFGQHESYQNPMMLSGQDFSASIMNQFQEIDNKMGYQLENESQEADYKEQSPIKQMPQILTHSQLNDGSDSNVFSSGGHPQNVIFFHQTNGLPEEESVSQVLQSVVSPQFVQVKEINDSDLVKSNIQSSLSSPNEQQVQLDYSQTTINNQSVNPSFDVSQISQITESMVQSGAISKFGESDMTYSIVNDSQIKSQFFGSKLQGGSQMAQIQEEDSKLEASQFKDESPQKGNDESPQKVNDEVTKLQNELTSLNKQKQINEQKITELTNTNTQMQSHLQIKERNLNELEKKLKLQSVEFNLKQELQQKDETIIYFKENQHLKKEVDRITKGNVELQKQLSLSSLDLQSKSMLIIDLQAQLEQLNKQQLENTQVQQESDRKYEELEQQYRSEKEQRQQVEKKLETIMQEKVEQEEEWKSLEGKQQQELDELKDNNSHLQQSLLTTMGSKVDISQLSELESQINEQLKLIGDQRVEISRLKENSEKMALQDWERNGQVQDLKSEIEQLSQELINYSSCKESILALQHKILTQSEEKGILVQNLVEMEKIINSLKGENDSFSQEIETKNQELDSLVSQFQEEKQLLMDEISKISEEIQVYSKKINQQEQLPQDSCINDALFSQLEATKLENQQKQLIIEQNEVSMQQLQNQLKQHENDVNKISELTDQITLMEKDIQNIIQQKDDEISQLKQSLSKVLEEIKMGEDEVATLKQQKSRLKEGNETLMATIINLENNLKEESQQLQTQKNLHNTQKEQLEEQIISLRRQIEDFQSIQVNNVSQESYKMLQDTHEELQKQINILELIKEEMLTKLNNLEQLLNTQGQDHQTTINQLHNVQQELTQSEDQIQSLKHTLNTASMERQNYLDVMEDQKVNLQNSQDQVIALNQELERLKQEKESQIQILQSKNEELTNEYSVVSTKLTNLEDEKIQLSVQLEQNQEDMSKEKDLAQQEIDLLKNECSYFKNKSEELEQTLNQLQDLVDTLKDEINYKNKQLEEFEEMKKTLQEMENSSIAQMQNLEKEWEEKTAVLIKDRDNKIEELENKINIIKSEHQKKDQQVINLQDELQQLASQHQDLGESNHQLAKQSENVQQQVFSLNQDQEAKSKQIDLLEQQLESSTAQVNDLLAKFQRQEETDKKQNQLLEQLQRELELAENQKEDIKINLDIHQDKLQKALNKQQELKVQYEMRNQVVEQQLTQKLDQLSKEKKQIEGQLELITVKQNGSTEQLNQLQKQKSDLESSVQQLNEEVNFFKQDNVKLNEQIKVQRNEISQLKQRLDSLDKDKQQLLQEIAQEQLKSQHLMDDLSTFEQKLYDLESEKDQQIIQLTDEKTRLNNKCLGIQEELKESVQELKKKVKDFTSNIDEKDKQINGLSNSVNQYQQDSSAFNQKDLIQKQEITELMAKVEQYNGIIEQLQRGQSFAQKEYTQCKGMADQLQKDYDNLVSQHAKTVEQMLNQGTQLQRQKQTIEDQEQQMGKLSQENQQNVSREQKHEILVHDLKRQIDDQEEQIAQLRSELQRKNEKPIEQRATSIEKPVQNSQSPNKRLEVPEFKNVTNVPSKVRQTNYSQDRTSKRPYQDLTSGSHLQMQTNYKATSMKSQQLDQMYMECLERSRNILERNMDLVSGKNIDGGTGNSFNSGSFNKSPLQTKYSEELSFNQMLDNSTKKPFQNTQVSSKQIGQKNSQSKQSSKERKPKEEVNRKGTKIHTRQASVKAPQSYTKVPFDHDHLISQINQQTTQMAQLHQQKIGGDVDHLKNYKGDTLNGCKHGRGKLLYENGDIYDGEWYKDQRYGYGTLKNNTQEIYLGYWQYDQMNGCGHLNNKQSVQVTVPLDYKNLEEIGQKWVNYQGEFQNGVFHGYGTLILTNGERFHGSFLNGKAQGTGQFQFIFILIFKRTYYRQNGEIIPGQWRNNQFVDKYYGRK